MSFFAVYILQRNPNTLCTCKLRGGYPRPDLKPNASRRGAALTRLQQRPRPRRKRVAHRKILVVEDELAIRKLLRLGLKPQGYELMEASDEKTSLQLLSENPDLVILDLELASVEGLKLLRKIRSRDKRVPIIVFSTRSEGACAAKALDLGANDFVTKPFDINELLARIQVAARHWSHGDDERLIFRIGDLSVDLMRRSVEVAGREIKLPPKQYELLQILVHHAGKILTPGFLLRELRDEASDVPNLRVCVCKLRQKIESDPNRPQYILTETGIGYRLRVPQVDAI